MGMQKLSVEQVAILTILYDLEFKATLLDEKTLEEETNRDRFAEKEPNMDFEKKEIEDIIEELQYWGYINEDYDLTVLGRQYLKTGPDCTESDMGNITTKNYNISLFEKLADIRGINVDFSASASIFNSLSDIFNWTKKE